MKQQRKEKKSHGKARKHIAWWVVLAFAAVIGFGIFSYAQIQYYESSVLEIYADSQDAYVQLVLDQINLLEDRTDDEIVSNILSTLDSSSNRYWTFSTEETMIFVKDIAETNRYKGFTTSTYYVSSEAKQFIEKLSTNKVSHDIIPIDSKVYVISGVAFCYNNAEYQICLLTNQSTVLEHNVYLNAKINLSIAITAVLLLCLLAVIFLTIMYERKSAALNAEKKVNGELRLMVEKLTAAVEREKLFDTQLTVFHHNVLPMLMEKLEKREITPITTVYLEYDKEEEKRSFLLQSQVLLDRHVFRFQNEQEKKLTLVTIQCSREAVMCALKPLLKSGVRLVQVVTTERLK